MDGPSLLSISADAPWFVHFAAQPLLQLLELNPHLNVSALASSPPVSPVRFTKNHLERRDSCYTLPGTNPPGSSPSGPSGALIGGIVGAVVGVILLVLLGWFLLRHRRRQRQNANAVHPNNMNVPPGVMPTPYDPNLGHNGAPPTMKQAGSGGYDMMNGGVNSGMGPNYTPAVYPAPPSSSGWSGTNTGSGAPLTGSSPQDRQSYYNYAPPPSDFTGGFMPNPNAGQPGPWNPTAAGATMHSSTPSPPPPSSTPGATSAQSGTTGSGYAPWSIPHSSSPGPSISGVASGSSSPVPVGHGPPGGMMFPSAAEEKAHYSGKYHPPSTPKEEEAKVRVSAPTPAPPAYEPYTGVGR